VLRLLRWANLLLLIFTLGAYLAPFISPAKHWQFAFIGLSYPLLLVLNLLFVLFWTWQKKWHALLSLGVILLGWGHVKGLVGMGWGAADPGPGQSMRLMTYNAMGFNDNWNSWMPADLQQWKGMLVRYQPDVLCLQEFWYAKKSNGPAYIEAIHKTGGLPHAYWKPLEELAIFSRYPILRSEVRWFGTTNGYRYADLQVGERIIRVYNVHLRSNSITGLADKVVESGNLKEKQTWLNIRGMMGRFRRAARERAEQVEELCSHIANSPYPVLVCGDLNDIPQSYSYHRMASLLDDAFKTGGRGLGITYAGRIPSLRIDYIFTDQRFQTIRCRRGQVGFSDHRPVIAHIAFGEPK
jgi:endonuclease/exonuclease/phosphatase (EEP) superfamily protein YafD